MRNSKLHGQVIGIASVFRTICHEFQEEAFLVIEPATLSSFTLVQDKVAHLMVEVRPGLMVLWQNTFHWWILREVDWIVGGIVTLWLDLVLCEFVSSRRWSSAVFDEICELKFLIFVVLFNRVKIQGSINIKFIIVVEIHIIETIITFLVYLGRFGSGLRSIYNSDEDICDF